MNDGIYEAVPLRVNQSDLETRLTLLITRRLA